MFSVEESKQSAEGELSRFENSLSSYDSVNNLIAPVYGDEGVLLQLSIKNQYEIALRQANDPNEWAQIMSCVCFWSYVIFFIIKLTYFDILFSDLLIFPIWSFISIGNYKLTCVCAFNILLCIECVGWIGINSAILIWLAMDGCSCHCSDDDICICITACDLL